MTVEEVMQLSGFGTGKYSGDGLIICRSYHVPHLLGVRGGVFEQSGDICVLRVNSAFKSRLSGCFGDDRHAVSQAIIINDELRVDGPGRLVMAPDLRRPAGTKQRVSEYFE